MESHSQSFGSNRSGSGIEHVLVVEDDDIIVELIRSIVTKLGYAVVAAGTASEALEEFELCSETAVCVILDYGIPGMDPSRLLCRMREIKSDVKVLVSSGYSSKFIEKDFPLDTVAGFIPKPYEAKLLIETIRKVVKQD